MKLNDYIASATDEQLISLNRKVVAEIKLRNKMKAHRIKQELEIGMLCTITSSKPAYMIGATVQITAINDSRAVVNIIQGPSFRGRARTGITYPFSCLTPIHAPDTIEGIEI